MGHGLEHQGRWHVTPVWQNIPVDGRRTVVGWSLFAGFAVLALWPPWLVDDLFFALKAGAGTSSPDGPAILLTAAVRGVLLVGLVACAAVATARLGRDPRWTRHLLGIAAPLLLLGGLGFAWFGGISAEAAGDDQAKRWMHTWVGGFASYPALCAAAGLVAVLALQRLRGRWIVLGAVAVCVGSFGLTWLAFLGSAGALHPGVVPG